jgi:NitT/TauT family transport system ATP-binding protein
MKDDVMLAVEQLNKQFNGIPVIEKLSFRLLKGERMALFAASGAGKTTLLRILAGLEKADSGQIDLAEGNPTIIFQEPRLFPFLTLQENILLPYKAQGSEINSAVLDRYQNWLEVCELTACGTYYPYQLSGGMKQKAAIIRAMLPLPRFVLMDEPFQSIGFEGKEALVHHLLTENPQLTSLFITHIPQEIPLMAHSVLVFQRQCLCQPLEVPAEAFNDVENIYPYPARLMQTDKSEMKIDF